MRRYPVGCQILVATFGATLGSACDAGSSVVPSSNGATGEPSSGASPSGGAPGSSSGSGGAGGTSSGSAGQRPTGGVASGGTASSSAAAGAAGATGSSAAGASTGGVGQGGVGQGGLASGGGGSSNGGESGSASSGGSGGAGSETTRVFTGSTNGTLTVFELELSGGGLTAVADFDTGADLDFLTLAPDGRTLFVSGNRRVASYAFDPATAVITPSFEQTTGGVGTHVAVDSSGGHVFVAHYDEGAISHLRYDSSSGFGVAQHLEPGDNAHQVRLGPAGSVVHVPCLGSDYVYQYELDASAGTLSPAASPTANVADGPRHLDYHPGASTAYVLTELSSQVHAFPFDPSTGALAATPSSFTYTSEDEQYHWSSDVHASPDGGHVYAVNRDPEEIVRFEVQEDYSLMRLGADPLAGVVRSFAIDESGGVVVAGDDNGNVTTWLRDASTGALTLADIETGLGNVHATTIAVGPPSQ